MLTVSAPVALRLERLCHRDAASAEDVMRRMKRQWSDAMREAKSHFVVCSDGKTPLLPQVLTVHHAMLALINKE
jgi:dephospho-CoA kinase